MHRRNLLAAALASLALPAIGQTIPDTVDEPVTITFYNYNLAMAGNGEIGRAHV